MWSVEIKKGKFRDGDMGSQQNGLKSQVTKPHCLVVSLSKLLCQILPFGVCAS